MSTPQPPLDRTKVTFEQAEGLEPLPSQLRAKELTPRLRAELWRLTYRTLRQDAQRGGLGEPLYIGGSWRDVLEDHHVERLHGMVDEYSSDYHDVVELTKNIVTTGSYGDVFGFFQYVLRHDSCPFDIRMELDGVLEACQSAYRVVGSNTIVPVASEAERLAIAGSFRVVSDGGFYGGQTHLRQSAGAMSDGRYADSVRESIHAVESVARAITGREKLSDALTELEKNAKMHKAMKGGFDRLYGWTSDEQGIRHPLLDEGDANVTEADALFMLGVCASFVSLLISKGRAAGLVEA